MAKGLKVKTQVKAGDLKWNHSEAKGLRVRARSVLCLLGGGSLLLGLLASPASAEPKPKQGRCVSELARAGLIGPNLNPGKVNFVVGTEGEDLFDPALFTDGVDVICGFGGGDFIQTIDAGDIFLGGEGNDFVVFNFGTFNGGEGDDFVFNNFGTFNGGPGEDFFQFNFGTFNQD